jgi:small subunit ribosomal protein S2
MARTNYNELLDAGVHFGHLKRKWNPNMAPYIFMERNGIHIIDLNKTIAKIDTAAAAMKQIAKSGKKILFVATKKQAKDVVANLVKQINMPYVTERWPGGMLTNFATIRKAVKKMSIIDKMETDGTFKNMSKRERLQVMRERAKLEKQLGSIVDLNRLPAAVFIVDISKEHIAVAEARKLNIPTFAITDTNTNPNEVDFPIPGNDDASKAIHIIVKVMIEAIQEGLEERKLEKDKAADDDDEGADDIDVDGDNVDDDAVVELEDLKDKKIKKVKKIEDDDEAPAVSKGPKGIAKKPVDKRPRLK